MDDDQPGTPTVCSGCGKPGVTFYPPPTGTPMPPHWCGACFTDDRKLEVARREAAKMGLLPGQSTRRYEYKSTTGDSSHPCDDPEAPEGDGWRLAAATHCFDSRTIFWFWEREVV